MLEVIATVVQGSAGRDGKYRVRISDKQIATYLKAARKHKALLLLNIQPGRSEFMIEAKAYERWLREPDVGVALDPEWAMDAGQRPGGAYGHTTGAELNRTARYLARLVKRHDLPEKVMVYHQVAASVVRRESGLKAHDGVAIDQVRRRARPAGTQDQHLPGGQPDHTEACARRIQAVLHRGPTRPHRSADDARARCWPYGRDRST